MMNRRFFKTLYAAAIFALSLCVTMPTRAMTFSEHGSGGNCSRCVWTQASGEIAPETPAQFAAYHKGEGGVVLLDSEGGDLKAAIQLGALFRKKRVEVIIGKSKKEPGHPWSLQDPGMCASACVYAAVGAVSRTLIPESRVGVHQFFRKPALQAFDDATSLDGAHAQAIAGLLALYLHEMGVSPSLLFVASTTRADSVYWLTEADLRTTAFLTQDSAAEPWRIEPVENQLLAVSSYKEVNRERVNVSVSCRPGSSGNQANVILAVPVRRTTDAQNYLSEITTAAGSMTIEPDGSYEARIDAGKPVITLKQGILLAESALSQKTLISAFSRKTIEFDVELPNYLGAPFHATLDGQDGARFVAAVLRRC